MTIKKDEDLGEGPRSSKLISYLNDVEIFFLKLLILGIFVVVEAIK